MPLAIPPELKPITAYIRRSEELDADKSDPNNIVIAYYCRAYAMEKAMDLGASSSESVNTFLMSLMQNLETSKAGISTSREEARIMCEGHAVDIFHLADDGDRSSSDDKNYREIARTFYNSSTFFDILEQFGALDEEMNSKRTYSKWKATEIMKALKEGRVPVAGGYGGEDARDTTSIGSSSDSVADNGSGGVMDISLPPAPTTFQPPPSQHQIPLDTPPSTPSFQIPPQPFGQTPPQPFGQTSPPPQPLQPFQPPQFPQAQFQIPQPPQQQQQPASHQPSPNYVPPQKSLNLQGNIADAMELCAFAMAALKTNDTRLGRERLRDALNLLS